MAQQEDEVSTPVHEEGSLESPCILFLTCLHRQERKQPKKLDEFM